MSFYVLTDWIDHAGERHTTQTNSVFPSCEDAEAFIRTAIQIGVIRFDALPDAPPDKAPGRFYIPLHRVVTWSVWEAA